MHPQKNTVVKQRPGRPGVEYFHLKGVLNQHNKPFTVFEGSSLRLTLRMVNAMFAEADLPRLASGFEVFERFAALHDHEGNKIKTFWMSHSWAMIGGEPPTAEQAKENIWVSPNWIASIEEAIKGGIVRVALEPDGRLHVPIYDTIGYTAAGERMLILDATRPSIMRMGHVPRLAVA